MICALAALLFAGVQPRSAPASQDGSALGGALDAPIRIEVFSDFQCPACRTLYLETIRPVLREYCSKDKVCVIYYDFPLQMHPYARVAARWAQAARSLGRAQWLAVVDALYTHQPKWSENGSIEATVSGVITAEELQKLKKGLNDPAIERQIERELTLGNQREVKSTPTFFVTAVGREQRVVGGLPYPVLKDFFDRIVK
jgi:protein-disulfide isomerase